MKQKTGRKLLSFLLTLAMLVGLMPGMGLTAYAAPTETLLTTITGTGSNAPTATSANVSYSTEGVATLTFSGSVSYQASPAWGWWGYGWTATVTPAGGYNITKCIFYDDANRTATDSSSPFVVETTEEDKTPRINGSPIDGGNNQSKGLKKIEVYGYATPAHTHDFTYSASGGTITATCGEDCDITTGLTLTISAPTGDLTADGTKTFPATLSTGYNTTAFPEGSISEISYAKDGDSTFTGTPTEAGTYTASVTVGEGQGAATASVSYTVNATAQDLADAKTTATETVNGVNAADYIAADQQTVTNAKTTALAAIEAATTTAAVETALTNFNTAISGCTTQAAADLATAKTNATAEVNAVNASDYIAADQQTVTNAKSTALAAIEAATTEAEVTTALNTFNTAIGNCTTQAAADLATAKTNATTTVNAVNASDYIETDQQTVTNAKSTALAAIEAATTEAEVTTALNTFNTAIGNCTTQAAADLATAKTNATTTVNAVNASDYIETDQQTVTNAKSTALAAIEAATTEAEVTTALNTFNTAIGNCTTQAAANLATAKTNATATVNDVDANDYIEADRQTVTNAKTTALNAINTATTEAEVTAALTNFNNAIAGCTTQAAADQTAANAVSDTINALPAFADVTTANKDAIEAARTAYNALTNDQKALVSADTLKKLTDAEDKLVIIQVMSEVSAKSGSGLTYTGNKIQLINTPTTALPAGYTMKYAVTTENVKPTDESLYTTSIPTGTDAGTYYVWYKVVGDENHADSDATCVTSKILADISKTVTFKVVNGSWDSGEGDAATADQTVTLTGFEGDTLKLTADQIPEVGNKPNDTYKEGSWDVTPSTETEITAATTYTYTYLMKDSISQTVTFKVVNGSWNDGEAKDKVVKLEGFEGDTIKLSADKIPSVGTKPSDGYKEGSWDTVPKADTEIKADTTYTYTYAKKEEVKPEPIVEPAPVQKIKLTVTAKDQTIAFGTAISQASSKYTIKGLQTGDEAKVTLKADMKKFTITPVVTVKNGDKDVTDTYDITAVSANIAISQVPMVAAISKGKSITATLTKIQNVDGYLIYTGYCGGTSKLVKTVKGNKAVKYTYKKIAGKALDRKKASKVIVKAYRLVDGKKVVVATSMTAHVAGIKDKKLTNASSVTVAKKTIVLKSGKTANVDAKVVLTTTKKAQLSKGHAAEIRYVSSNIAVATVDANGKITAKGKGKCTVYAVAVDGKRTTVNVKVE